VDDKAGADTGFGSDGAGACRGETVAPDEEDRGVADSRSSRRVILS